MREFVSFSGMPEPETTVYQARWSIFGFGLHFWGCEKPNSGR